MTTNPNDDLKPFPENRGEPNPFPSPIEGKKSWEASSHLWTPQAGLEQETFPPHTGVIHD